MKLKKYILPGILFLALGFSSCVDTELEETLEYKNHYKTVADANNAVLGIYGQFMGLAEQVVVLNELRGDLVDLTPNSNKDLQEINSNTPSKSNTYADPTAFYKVIQNCNDALANFKIMQKESKLTKDQFNELYSDVDALRCWLYLQLGIQYGDIPYITDATVTLDDVKKAQTAELTTFDNLLDSLITEMESLPTKEDYVNSDLVKYTLDGYSLTNFFAKKHLILGDLYMWRGKSQDDYVQAATHYRTVLATNESTGDGAKYRCSTWPTTATFRLQIFYQDNHPDDANSLLNNWKQMFSRTAEDRDAANELIWTVSYDESFQPTYPFIRLFGNQGKGQYLLRPSSASIGKWNSEVQSNSFPYDSRGPESSYAVVNGDTVVQKYLYSYDATKPYIQSGRWWLYRAGELMLRYAEAANRAGYPKLAYAIVNTGFGIYSWTRPTDIPENVWNQKNRRTGWGPDNYYPAPFYFAARNMDVPYIRDAWRDFNGIRGRAALKTKPFPAGFTTADDSIKFMEKTIVDEYALECAYEGNRWSDLTRVARRMNRTGEDGTAYLNAMLNKKYKGATPDYSTEKKWYLPYSFK